jgi:hypothetical protein
MAKYQNYFILDTERFEAKCKLCVENRIVKYSASSKSNLKAHIESVHRHTPEEQKAKALGIPKITDALACCNHSKSPWI